MSRNSSTFVYADPPQSATHSALDLFTTPQVLMDFHKASDVQVFAPTNANEPLLEFSYTTPKTDVSGSVADLKNTYLKLELQLVRAKTGDTTDDPKKLRPIFVNNLGQSLFSNVEVELNGTQVSNSNGLHPYKAILEADLSYDFDAKQGWLACQGYAYEGEPHLFLKDSKTTTPSGFKRRHEIVATGRNWNYYFKIADSFMNGVDRYLLPGVEVRVKLSRAASEFVLMQTGNSLEAEDFSLRIVSASMFFHILELRNDTFTSIERGLQHKAAQYEYREVVAKSFLIGGGTTTFTKDDIFARAPINRLVMAMVPEENFTGSYQSNPFNFVDFDLNSIQIKREDLPVGGTPIQVGTSHVRAYMNTMRALGFEHGGNGITLDQFNNHFCPVFQLAADLHLDDDTIRPELTGARLTVELKFKSPTVLPIRLILLGERRSVVLIDCNREVVKNSSIYNG